jgi:hypothetical protein
MCFKYHRTTSRKRRDGISTSNRKGKRKIARTENSHRAKCALHAPDISFGQRFSVWVSGINAGIDP